MILMIDNYDSFTYNLVQYLYMLNQEIVVHRNDRITVNEALELKPDCIIISPGPGRPEDAGIIIDLIKAAAGRIPILGVCLGHQAIGYAFGAKVISAKQIMHGKVSEVEHDGKGIFTRINSPLKAVRYHSLALEESSMPECLEVSARTPDGEIMGIRHKDFPIEGIQFHPESVMTTSGKRQMANFIANLEAE